jgi:chromosome partitioning protein
MAKIISIVNQKGGVGKTTTSVNLATYLAKLGNFVLLVDLDPQSNATSGIGIDNQKLPASLYDVLMGSHNLHQTIIPLKPENLRLAPSDQNLAGANIELVSHNEREHRLHSELQPYKHEYDYIIIDSPHL